MDWLSFFDALLSTQTPWLPDPALLRWGRGLCWGLVLAVLVFWLARRWPRRSQFGLAGLMLAWNLLPGPLSPAYWFGLAFQAPSLMTVVLSLLWGAGQLRLVGGFGAPQWHALWPAAAAGIVVGWLLLLDTLALWPVSLYAVGFRPAAVGMLAVMACLPWVVYGPRPAARLTSLLLGAVLLLYVVLRLPSGNAWDALLDPLLWLALQAAWLWRGLRRFIGPRRVPATTRA